MARIAQQHARGSKADSVRAGYVQYGTVEYYRRFGATYRNPHEPIVRRILATVVPHWGIDLFRVLDLAAGSGEVTLALQDAGAEQIEGIDPYTEAAYKARTGRTARRLSFEQIAEAGLGGRYSLIVCSFALHLCEVSRLPRFAYQLSLASKALLVLTPHKRPILQPAWGWTLERESVIERVRTRLYQTTQGTR